MVAHAPTRRAWNPVLDLVGPQQPFSSFYYEQIYRKAALNYPDVLTAWDLAKGQQDAKSHLEDYTSLGAYVTGNHMSDTSPLLG